MGRRAQPQDPGLYAVAQVFTVQVEIKGLGIAEATGTSKQEAETLAAKQFLAEHGR